jgi:hypothetical protein
MVFWGSSCRETPKNAIKQNRWEKTTGNRFFFLNFFGQKLLTWCFLTPLVEKRTKTPFKKKKKYLPTPFSGHLPDIRRFFFLFFGAPWDKGQGRRRKQIESDVYLADSH